MSEWEHKESRLVLEARMCELKRKYQLGVTSFEILSFFFNEIVDDLR